MRRIKILPIVALIILLLSACSSTKFDGSRTGNESQLIMEYKVLNKEDYQILELENGDTVDFKIVSESGKVDIILQKDGEKPVYKGVDIPTSSFSVDISESGKYKVSVIGKNAKGNISIIKRHSDK